MRPNPTAAPRRSGGTSRRMNRRAPTHHPRAWLNGNQQDLVYDFYHREPVVQVARRVVLSTLLSGGLRIVGTNGADATSAFERVVDRHWKPFVYALYDSFMMFGFAVYTVVAVKEQFETPVDAKDAARRDGTDRRPAKRRYQRRTVRVPYILPYGSYRVEIRHDRVGYATYHVFLVNDALVSAEIEEATHVHVMVSAAFPPSRTGLIRSPLLSLLPGARFSRRLHEYAARTEFLRAHPPLITEARPEPATATDAVAMEMFADGDIYAGKEDASYAKNRRHMNDFHRQMAMAATLNGKRARDRGVTVDPFTGKATRARREADVWEERVFVLPDGQKLSGHLQPQSRSDLVELERHRLDTVCAVMGVPKSMVLQTRTAGGSIQSGTGTDATYRGFVRALECTARDLVAHLHDVYKAVYRTVEKEVVITFPFLPVVELTDLALVGELGLVSRETLGRRMISAIGLPDTDMALQATDQAILKMTRPENKPPPVKPPPPTKKTKAT